MTGFDWGWFSGFFGVFEDDEDDEEVDENDEEAENADVVVDLLWVVWGKPGKLNGTADFGIVANKLALVVVEIISYTAKSAISFSALAFSRLALAWMSMSLLSLNFSTIAFTFSSDFFNSYSATEQTNFCRFNLNSYFSSYFWRVLSSIGN